MRLYVKYDIATKEVTEQAPINKDGVSNYNHESNHVQLLADGYTHEEVESGYNNKLYLVGYAPVQPFEELKSRKLIDLKYANEYAENNGYIELSNGVRVDGRRTDLGNIQGLISLTSKGFVPLPISFRDYYNKDQAVTLENLQEMETLIEVRGISLYSHKWTLEGTVNAATTQEELDAIDVNSGWPGID